MGEQNRALATIICADLHLKEMFATLDLLGAVVDVVTYKKSGAQVVFSGIDEGAHLTGPVLLLKTEKTPANIDENVKEHLAPFAPLSTYDLTGDDSADRDGIIKLVLKTLDGAARNSAGRNMDLRRQIARLRVEMETTFELVQTLKAQNKLLGGSSLNQEILRWGPGRLTVQVAEGGFIEQRLPRETRGTPLGAVCVLATNRHDTALECSFQILNDDTQDIMAERVISVAPGQNWVLFSIPEHGLSMFEFRHLRITPLGSACEFLSFRKTDAVEPVENLFVNNTLEEGALALRVYSDSFDDDVISSQQYEDNSGSIEIALPQPIINNFKPLSTQIKRPEKWFTTAKNRVMVHPSKDDISLVRGGFQNTDHMVLGLSVSANLNNAKSHPTMVRYLVLPQPDDDAVFAALRKDGSSTNVNGALADSGWTTLLPLSQSTLPVLEFDDGVESGQLYLATRPAAGKTEYCHLNFVNFLWFLGNRKA